MLNSLIIRVAAGGTLALGGALFAAESGLIEADSDGTQTDEEVTQTSASRPAGSTISALPEIEDSNVIVPLAEQALAPQAGVVPTSFEEPADTPSAQVPQFSELGLPCGVTVTATAMPAAMVALDVMAPCRSETDLTITHSGLQIMSSTDAVGLLSLDIPAFETPAFFSIAMSDGSEETVLVGLPDLQDFDRIGLSWQGNMGLELHALEFGAEFGDAGHVWQDSPAAPEAAISGDGGFLTRVETGESFAQIYTLPRATLREGDSVRLSIDAPITQTNCSHDVLARTLRAEGGNPVDVTELSFTVPSCEAVGDVLVLQNLLDDLRLAAN